MSSPISFDALRARSRPERNSYLISYDSIPCQRTLAVSVFNPYTSKMTKAVFANRSVSLFLSSSQFLLSRPHQPFAFVHQKQLRGHTEAIQNLFGLRPTNLDSGEFLVCFRGWNG